jgi:hypothetical protein
MRLSARGKLWKKRGRKRKKKTPMEVVDLASRLGMDDAGYPQKFSREERKKYGK